MRRVLPISMVLSLILGGLMRAGVAPNGPEFKVNTYTTNYQRHAAVGMNSAGHFVVAWESYLQDGSYEGVFGQMFDSGGSPIGTEFQVNTYTTYSQIRPAVGMNAAGAFVVAWESLGQDGSSWGVFGQMFDSGGSPIGTEFQVSTYTTDYQVGPAVGMNATGEFVLTWESKSQDGSSFGIFGQMFDSGGSPIGAEFQVNTYTTNDQYHHAVGINAAGDFVVAWQSYMQDGSYEGVFGQMFDSGGSPIGTEFQVNTYTTYSQNRPAVGMNAAGDFVVAWGGPHDGSGYGIFGQMFDSTGTPLAAEFQVNTYTSSSQKTPAVGMNAAGDFVVAWGSPQDGSGDGVFGQMFDSGGSSAGVEFQVNTYTTYSQSRPAVGVNAAGDFVVAWESFTQDGSDWGAFAQRFVAHSVVITAPLSSVDCSDPKLSQPTIVWDADTYDVFKVYMGSSPGFEKGTSVTSGDKAIKIASWAPSGKKWTSACNKAVTQAADPNSPVMYIAVFGTDKDLSKNDPARKRLSPVVALPLTP